MSQKVLLFQFLKHQGRLFVPEAAIVHKSVDGPSVAEWVEAEIRLRQVPRDI